MIKPTKGMLSGNKVIIRSKSNLRSGDQVLIVEPTTNVVISSRTGRFLGLDEKIIGRGHVVNNGNELCVILHSQTDGTRSNVQSMKERRLKAKASKGKDVLIKIINGKSR